MKQLMVQSKDVLRQNTLHDRLLQVDRIDFKHLLRKIYLAKR